MCLLDFFDVWPRAHNRGPVKQKHSWPSSNHQKWTAKSWFSCKYQFWNRFFPCLILYLFSLISKFLSVAEVGYINPQVVNQPAAESSLDTDTTSQASASLNAATKTGSDRKIFLALRLESIILTMKRYWNYSTFHNI